MSFMCSLVLLHVNDFVEFTMGFQESLVESSLKICTNWAIEK